MLISWFIEDVIAPFVRQKLLHGVGESSGSGSNNEGHHVELRADTMLLVRLFVRVRETGFVPLRVENAACLANARIRQRGILMVDELSVLVVQVFELLEDDCLAILRVSQRGLLMVDERFALSKSHRSPARQPSCRRFRLCPSDRRRCRLTCSWMGSSTWTSRGRRALRSW